MLAWSVLLMGCGLVLQEPSAGSLPSQPVEEATAQIRAATNEFYHLIGSRRFTDAYRNVSSGSAPTLADFESSLTRRYPEGTQLVDLAIIGVNVDGDLGTVSVEAQWRRGRSQSVDSVTLPVVRQTDGWKIEWNG